ncbi:hypothetical protein [Pendulispora albinea]|uniref:Uncharacterized protein n=1 Tax=Pendulispora albinea TaxID=2741071 RepID=A0ABZ2M3E8_9BACT
MAVDVDDQEYAPIAGIPELRDASSTRRLWRRTAHVCFSAPRFAPLFPLQAARALRACGGFVRG